MLHRLVIIFCVTAFVNLSAASRLSITKTCKIPTEGLTLKIPKGWRVNPLASMTDFEDKRSKKRAVSVRDYWLRQGQHIIQYTQDNVGNLSIARLRYNFPTSRHSVEFKEVLDAFFADPANKFNYKNKAAMQVWINTFTTTNSEFKQLSLKELGLRSPSGTVLKVYSDSRNYFMLFYIKSRRAFIGMNWQFPVELDVKNIKKTLLSFSRSLRFGKPQKVKRDLQSSKLQRSDSNGKNSSEKFKASKEKVITDLKNLPDWYYVETKNYLVCSNMPSRYRSLIKKVQTNVELFHTAYKKLVPQWQQVDDISVVKMFATRKGYVNYVGDDYKWSAGLWMPSKQELVISPPSYDQKKNDAIDQMLETVYHEAFHQYLYYATSRVGNAVWFNEGHAKFIEDAEIKSNKFLVVEENEYKANLINKYIKQKNANISGLIALTHAQFYDEYNRTGNYNLGWALTYYLRKHCEPLKNEYSSILSKYSEELHKSNDLNKATKSAFYGVNMDQLQKDFEEFWQGRSPRKKASSRKIFVKK